MLLMLALAFAEPPAFIEELIQTDHDLPRYAEQYYHPLGRSPVVDVLLGDPMYSVRFADESSRQLRKAADSGSAAAVSEVAAQGAVSSILSCTVMHLRNESCPRSNAY